MPLVVVVPVPTYRQHDEGKRRSLAMEDIFIDGLARHSIFRLLAKTMSVDRWTGRLGIPVIIQVVDHPESVQPEDVSKDGVILLGTDGNMTAPFEFHKSIAECEGKSLASLVQIFDVIEILTMQFDDGLPPPDVSTRRQAKRLEIINDFLRID